MNKNIYSIITLCLLLVGLNYLNAWTGPATSPLPTNPPNNNVAAPINVGGIMQVKAGDLGAATFIADNVVAANEVESLTKMLSPEYCDENGANCFDSLEVGAAGGLTSCTLSSQVVSVCSYSPSGSCPAGTVKVSGPIAGGSCSTNNTTFTTTCIRITCS